MFYFSWEKYVQCSFALQRMRVERRVFYPKISKRFCNIQHCTCIQKVAMHSMFNIKEFQACFNVFCMLLKILFYMGKVHTVCAYNADERRMFYPTISKRSCHIQHSTCTQKVAKHSMFNIKEFQPAFLTLYYTIKKWILHGSSACSMRLHCTKWVLKEGCFIRRYRSDPAMYSTVPAPKM